MAPAGSKNAPEAKARQEIDRLLEESGWSIQDRERIGQPRRILEALVLESEDVQAALVPRGELLVRENPPASLRVLLLIPRWFSLIAVRWVIARELELADSEAPSGAVLLPTGGLNGP